MRVSTAGRWLAMSCLVLLAACGGGGGGGGGSDAKLSLSPSQASLVATQFAGGALQLTGKLSPRPSASGTIYITVDDDGHTFYADADISGTADQFSAVVYSLPWLAPGTRTGTLTVRACPVSDCSTTFPGYAASVPYSVVVQPPAGETHRLQPSALAVSFASTPNASVLSRTLAVRDNFVTQAPWTATSDAAWLGVTPSGTSDATALVVTADAAGLPTNQTSIATITLSSPGLAGATIHVGLWKDSTGATTLSTAPAVNAVGLARDPYRPLVYATTGDDRILVYNAHTALLERTITGAGVHMGSLAVAPDGARLYALDGGGIVRVIDLATGASTAWTMPSAILDTANILVIRPNGEDVVLVGNGVAMARGNVVSTTGPQAAMAGVDEGSVVFSMDANSPSTISSWLTSWSSAGNQFFAVRAVTNANLGGSAFHGEEIALSGDGWHLYVADAVGGCMQVDPVTLAFVARFAHSGNGFTTGIATGASGNVACGYSSLETASDPVLGIFSATGSPLADFEWPTFDNGIASGLLVASSDGLVTVAPVPGTGDLLFAPMGQGTSDGTGHALSSAARLEGLRRLAPTHRPR